MAAFKGGYFGKFLDINLTTGEVRTRTFDEAHGRKYLGGTGLASYYMYTEIPKGADPLGPENLLIMAPGPLCGTQFPGARLSVNFKSPVTGGFGNTFIGGTVSQEIKFAGWDMIIFRGKAPKPVYVDIKDDQVSIRDASALWGQDTHHAEENIKEELDDPYARVLVIGPGGENQTVTACIISERFRAAGRGGGGAVMGSKNLKGLAVRGTKAVPIADPAKFHPIASDALRMSAVNDRNPGFRKYGTAQSMDQNNFVVGSLITRNFQTTWFPEITRIGSAKASTYFWQRHVGCMGCMISCMKFGVLRNSERWKGLVAEGPEYESGGMLGPNLGISEFDEMMFLIEYCDAMGIDNIGAPNVVAFTVELLEVGILKPADLDGIDAKWGDVDGIFKLFEALVYKKGKAGELLGLGVTEMAKKVGNGAEKYAVDGKNQGLAAHDPRGNRSMLWTYALGPRGGVHTDGNSAQGILDRILQSSMCMCYFVAPTFLARHDSIYIDVLNPLCGWNINKEEWLNTGRRILALQRAYSHREAGFDRKDDTVADRMFTPLPNEGPRGGAVITREEMTKMQDDYYALLEWDKDGLPSDATLKKFGLDFVIADMRTKK